MSNEITTFTNAEFGSIRTITIANEPWFVGKDAADILGYSNTRKALIDHVDDEDKGVTKCDTLGGVQGYIPIAPHLLFPQFLDDDNPEERELGLFFGNALMSKCSEVWVFGSRISSGMESEIKRAKWKNHCLRYFTEECQEV